MFTADQLRQWAEHLDHHGVMPPTEVNPALADELVKVLERLLADYRKRVPMADGFPEVAIATDILSRAAHQGPIKPVGG
jgi:hypothetical protein